MAKTKARPPTKAKVQPPRKVKGRGNALRASARRPQAKPRAKPSRKQTFVVSHHREEDFQAGLRSYAKYRDLGVAKATNGMVRAHVIRFVPPCRPEEVSK